MKTLYMNILILFIGIYNYDR